MRGEIFWKRITMFCLAFGIGFFITNAFEPKEISMQDALDILTSAPQKTKCIPADEKLKYLRLNKKSEISSEDLKKIEAEKTESKTEPQLFIPERDSVEHKTLLHKEKCFDSDGRR